MLQCDEHKTNSKHIFISCLISRSNQIQANPLKGMIYDLNYDIQPNLQDQLVSYFQWKTKDSAEKEYQLLYPKRHFNFCFINEFVTKPNSDITRKHFGYKTKGFRERGLCLKHVPPISSVSYLFVSGISSFCYSQPHRQTQTWSNVLAKQRALSDFTFLQLKNKIISTAGFDLHFHHLLFASL